MRSRLARVGVSLAAIGVLVGAVVIADEIVRSEMERVARREMALAMQIDDPDRVEARIDGGSAILQLLLGSVSHVSLTLPGIEVQGATGTMHLEIDDMPTNPVQPIPQAYSYLVLDQSALEHLSLGFVETPVIDVDPVPPALHVQTLVQLGTVSSVVTIDVRPIVEGDAIRLVAQAATVDGEALTPAQFEARMGMPLAALIDRDGLCVSDAVPVTMQPKDVRISNGTAIVVFGIEARSLDQLQVPHGVCA